MTIAVHGAETPSASERNIICAAYKYVYFRIGLCIMQILMHKKTDD